jgi:predicted amidohydrolase
MRAALVVHCVTAEVSDNVARMLRATEAASDAGAGLVVFPEMASTGFVNSGDPEQDRRIAETIPGPTASLLCGAARAHGVWIAVGVFERDDAGLYDSAILIDSQGCVRLKYRRIQPSWRTRRADPDVYRLGDAVRAVETPFGRVAFLLCGDLFDDGVVDRFIAAEPDLLLFPFARCFNDGSREQRRWDVDEAPEYLARVRRAGAPALMTNYLAERDFDGGSFGGAMHVSADGALLASLPLGVPGILYVEV